MGALSTQKPRILTVSRGWSAVNRLIGGDARCISWCAAKSKGCLNEALSQARWVHSSCPGSPVASPSSSSSTLPPGIAYPPPSQRARSTLAQRAEQNGRKASSTGLPQIEQRGVRMGLGSGIAYGCPPIFQVGSSWPALSQLKWIGNPSASNIAVTSVNGNPTTFVYEPTMR